MIDWTDLPVLRSPKRAQRDPSSRERLAWLRARRRKRKPSKAHSTNAERARLAIEEAAEAKRKRDRNAARFAAYWQGLSDEDPGMPDA